MTAIGYTGSQLAAHEVDECSTPSPRVGGVSRLESRSMPGRMPLDHPPTPPRRRADRPPNPAPKTLNPAPRTPPRPNRVESLARRVHGPISVLQTTMRPPFSLAPTRSFPASHAVLQTTVFKRHLAPMCL